MFALLLSLVAAPVSIALDDPAEPRNWHLNGGILPPDGVAALQRPWDQLWVREWLGLSARRGWSVEARFSVEWGQGCANQGLEVGAADDERGLYLMRRRGVIFVGDATHAVAEDGAPHSYRLELRDRRVRVFYDGVQVLETPLLAASPGPVRWPTSVTFGTMGSCGEAGGVYARWDSLVVDAGPGAPPVAPSPDRLRACQLGMGESQSAAAREAYAMRYDEAARLLRAAFDRVGESCAPIALTFYGGLVRRYEALHAGWGAVAGDPVQAAPGFVRELLSDARVFGLDSAELEGTWTVLYARDPELRALAQGIFPAALTVRWPQDRGSSTAFTEPLTRRAGRLGIPIAEQGRPRGALECVGVFEPSQYDNTRFWAEVTLRRGADIVAELRVDRGGTFVGSDPALVHSVAEQLAGFVVDGLLEVLLRRRYLDGRRDDGRR